MKLRWTVPVCSLYLRFTGSKYCDINSVWLDSPIMMRLYCSEKWKQTLLIQSSLCQIYNPSTFHFHLYFSKRYKFIKWLWSPPQSAVEDSSSPQPFVFVAAIFSSSQPFWVCRSQFESVTAILSLPQSFWLCHSQQSIFQSYPMIEMTVANPKWLRQTQMAEEDSSPPHPFDELRSFRKV